MNAQKQIAERDITIRNLRAELASTQTKLHTKHAALLSEAAKVATLKQAAEQVIIHLPLDVLTTRPHLLEAANKLRESLK